MKQGVSITASIDPETSALVTQAAAERGISPAEYVSVSVRRVAESEANDRAFIPIGIDAIARGDVVPHEDVVTEIDATIAKHLARCAG